jgi:glycosyltransferase involved in cell wall biosynthesis
MHTISVLIPAYNEEQYLAACLRSIVENRTPNVKEIIVIDNASKDRTPAIAKEFSGVRIVTEMQQGLTFARQRGVQEATGDIMAWIDADTRVDRRWFECITENYESTSALVCLSGPYKFYDLGIIGRLLCAAYWWILALPTYWILGFMAVGGNMAIRTDALQSIGGFDTSIEFYGEDTNIARRLSAKGKVKFDPFFVNYSSARRLKAQGFLSSGWVYIKNFFSQAFGKKSATKNHRDFR